MWCQLIWFHTFHNKVWCLNQDEECSRYMYIEERHWTGKQPFGTQATPLIARFMEPTCVGPRWAPCWPHDPCYLGHVCIWYYSTGVQIVSFTLSDDSVLSESTGLFHPVLCVSQWNLFWQKNQPMRLCLSNQLRLRREWFPSPLGDFNRFFEGLMGELFQIWHWNMFYFLNDTSLAPKM